MEANGNSDSLKLNSNNDHSYGGWFLLWRKIERCKHFDYNDNDQFRFFIFVLLHAFYREVLLKDGNGNYYLFSRGTLLFTLEQYSEYVPGWSHKSKVRRFLERLVSEGFLEKKAVYSCRVPFGTTCDTTLRKKAKQFYTYLDKCVYISHPNSNIYIIKRYADYQTKGLHDISSVSENRNTFLKIEHPMDRHNIRHNFETELSPSQDLNPLINKYNNNSYHFYKKNDMSSLSGISTDGDPEELSSPLEGGPAQSGFEHIEDAFFAKVRETGEIIELRPSEEDSNKKRLFSYRYDKDAGRMYLLMDDNRIFWPEDLVSIYED